MKLFKTLLYGIGLLVAAVAWLAPADRAAAVFTLTGTSAELVARGINADFETPAQTRGDGETTSTNNIGPGWTSNLISGVSNNYGVQDPNITYYGSTTGSLPAPFDGQQIGFFNLNNWFSQGEIVSDPIGRMQSGQTYTLNVAVGARNSTAQNKIGYRIGLRAQDGADLGTFTIATVVPTGAPSLSDLQYTLDMSTIPGSYVGKSARIVIGGYNTGLNPSDVLTDQLAQPNFDNVRLTGTFDDLITQAASLAINRQTGGITLSNTGAANLNVVGYSLTSVAGAFNQSQWTRIGSPLSQVSANGSTTDLSETDFQGGGTVLTTTTPRSLGNAWYKTPYQDVLGQLLLVDGSTLTLPVQYTGTAIASGDLNSDGSINVADWTIFKAGPGTNFTGLSKAQSYLKGDINGDLKHDLADFVLFRTAFNAANGAGAFESMLGSVPEPAAVLLLVMGGVFMLTNLRRHNRGQSVFTLSQASHRTIIAMLGLAVSALAASRATAQTPIAHWSFDTSSLTTSGSNITGVGEQTGNHNAALGATTGSGGGCPCNSNPIPTTNSIVGRYGQGLTLTGLNNVAGGGGQFLTYPNLNELTTVSSAPGAPSYSVSYWINTTTTNNQQFTVLGDWGNAATNPGRFTYGYGINFAAGVPQMRAQSRFNTTGAGNGTDIFARAANTTALNNGNWHMLTWTFNTTSGQLLSYYDAALVDTFNSAAANFNMIRSSSILGTWGLKGDTGNFLNGSVSLDEAYVFNGVLAQDQITALFNNNNITPITLTLRVDPSTGQTQMRNNSGQDIALNAYRITSSAGSLKPSGWTPISSQSISGFPAGDGSGNGWEVTSGASNPADYNGNGAVDSADYVLWRKSNINGPSGYNNWRAAFGAAGGPGGTAGELVEWYLRGNSTLANGASINLGQAFNIGGTQDLGFQFTTATGLLTGLVEYGSIGSGTALSAVPEPSTAWLMLVAGCALAVCASRRRRYETSRAPARILTIAGLLTSLWNSAAMAMVTNDRIYSLGDDSSEHASAGIAVGSGAGNVSAGSTLDSLGPSGSYQDLLASANAGGSLPVYADVSSRPGAVSGSLGILFDGTDDYLTGFGLGFPPITRSTARGATVTTPPPSIPGTLNYDGVFQRGFQLWVNPQSGATAAQHVVMDTSQHGLRITTGGTWSMVYAGTETNSNVAVSFNQWSHVMVAIPDITNPNRGVLYVNGVAIAANQANYSTNLNVNKSALVVGANTNVVNADGTAGTPATVGIQNFFRGTLDDLKMFVWGRSYDPLSGTFTNLGTFNFRTDNAYAAANLSPIFGDIAGSSGITQTDVNAFIAGWLHEKRVNSQRVGDITTYAAGDLNFDGITDLADAALFRQAMGLGAGAGLDLGSFNALVESAVPEPATWLLGTLSLISFVATIRRKRVNRQ